MVNNYSISIIDSKTQQVKRVYEAEFDGEINELKTILDKRYYPSIIKIEKLIVGR